MKVQKISYHVRLGLILLIIPLSIYASLAFQLNNVLCIDLSHLFRREGSITMFRNVENSQVGSLAEAALVENQLPCLKYVTISPEFQFQPRERASSSPSLSTDLIASTCCTRAASKYIFFDITSSILLIAFMSLYFSILFVSIIILCPVCLCCTALES